MWFVIIILIIGHLLLLSGAVFTDLRDNFLAWILVAVAIVFDVFVIWGITSENNRDENQTDKNQVVDYFSQGEFSRSEKERKLKKIVREHSLLCKKLLEINHRHEFLPVEWKEVFECDWQTFNNFDKKRYVLDLLKTKPQIINMLFENVKKNENIYKEYYKEFCACEEYTPEEQIKRIRCRKMSVKRFKELEKELKWSIMKERSAVYFSIAIQVKCQGAEKRIVVIQRELEEYKKEQLKLLQECLVRVSKEKRRIEYEKAKQFVLKHSEVVRRLRLMGEKYRFYNIKKPIFYVRCDNYARYNKFNIRTHVKEQLMDNPQMFGDFFEKADKNFALYSQYKKEYDACKYCLFTEITNEMEGVNFKEIREIEKKLYTSCLKVRPVWEKEIKYVIRYSSPTGRNQYQKEEYIGATDINELLKEIQTDEEKKKQQVIERQQEAKERAELKNLLKKQEELLKREEELARKEHEFLLATRGHIYTKNQEIVEQPISEEKKDSSDKLMILRDAFDRGEITFEEYQEEKKKLW